MYILSIHPDGEYFKVALLSQKGKRMKIEFIKDLRREIVDLNQLKRKIETATKHKEEALQVSSAFDPDELFTRTIHLPLKRKRAIMKALPFQIESILPFSPETSTTLPIIKKEVNFSKIALYSFLNETMKEHIQMIKAFGFDPDCVSTVPKALLRFVETFTTEASHSLIFHFGWARSYLVAISGGEPIFATTLQVGLKHFIDALQDRVSLGKEVDLLFLENEIDRCAKDRETSGEMGELLLEVQRQIYRAVEFLKRSEKLAESKGVIFTGYTEIIRKITQSIEALPAREIPLVPGLGYETKELAAYAIEIGLAIDGLKQDEETLQLRVGKFIPPRLIEQVKRKCKLFASLSLLTATLTFATICSYYMKKEAVFKERLTRLVNLSGEEVKKFPFLNKAFIREGDIQKMMSDLEKVFKSTRPEKLLTLPSMKVADTLEWVFPHLTREIDLQNLHYELLSFPTLGHTDQEMKVSQSILFGAKSEEEAKNFVEKLVKAEEKLIETHTLTKEGDVYRANFTFKDRL